MFDLYVRPLRDPYESELGGRTCMTCQPGRCLILSVSACLNPGDQPKSGGSLLLDRGPS